MKVFLSGRYERQRELCAVAAELVYLGHEVTSTWLHSTQERTDESEAAETIASRNWADLVHSDLVAVFTETPGSYPGGDRHVEFGIALALQQVSAWDHRFKQLCVCTVGPRQLTFHAYPTVPNYPTIDQFLLHMRHQREG